MRPGPHQAGAAWTKRCYAILAQALGAVHCPLSAVHPYHPPMSDDTGTTAVEATPGKGRGGARGEGARAGADPARADRAPAGVDAALLSAAAPAVEAMLICTERPLSAARLGEGLVAAGVAPAKEAAGADRLAKAAIERLNDAYEKEGRAFRIDAVAGGYRIMTTPEQAAAVAAIRGAQARTVLSRAAIETLAIIAYKQPMTRATLEAIRGVACGEILRSLIDRRFVTIAGRAEEPGRPMLYGTTKRFLEVFGLSSLKDLPTVEEFRARAGEGGDGEGGDAADTADAADASEAAAEAAARRSETGDPESAG